MHKKLWLLVYLGLFVALPRATQADTLFHWHFDGASGEELVYDVDSVSGAVAVKFDDASLGSGADNTIGYGQANPWYGTSETSADFLNTPPDNDPGVGLRVSDPGVDSTLDLSTTSACTIEAFVCSYDLRQSVIVRKYGSSGYDGVYYIDTRPEGKFAVRLAGNGQDIGDSGGICNDLTCEADQWYHVALVWNGTAARFYVNGVQSQDLSGSSEVAFSGPVGDSDRALGIGCIVRDNLDPPENSGQFFHGRIDEVRISNQALDVDAFLLHNESEIAWNPRPNSFAENTHPDVSLVWSPGDYADQHDVYLGTSFDDVNDADTSWSVYLGRRSPNSYNPPGLLDFGDTYYWRIDEVNDATLWKGNVWQFTVDDGKAYAPNPADGTSASVDAVLGWKPGVLATVHEVYFGTDLGLVSNASDPNVPPGRGRQDPNSYNPPGSLSSNTSYYWRIDEVGNNTFIKGDVWSFQVVEIYTSLLGMEFVRIEPGAFQMGSEDGDFDEVPVHSVTISEPFYMGTFEVTNAQYEQFDPNHGSIDHRGFSHEPNEAVVFVSWQDANDFCQWLSQFEGLPCRLPTEAEWEYACRAGTTTAYHTGETLPGEFLKNAEQTWGPEPVPLHVGQTPPNPWGLYDVHGNVEEWCSDWYGSYEAGAQTDPVGRVAGDFRVSRGGSHSTTVGYLRSANRMGTLPEDKHWLIGFRVVIGEMPTAEPLPEPGPELYQVDVNQAVPPDINEGPDPDIPYFEGPRTYVKIPAGSYGPLFSSHNHDPGFTHCPNGDLLAIWYTTISEPGRELAVAISRLRYGADEWEPASPFWDAPDRNDHCPAMWIDENGKIYQFAGLADAATWGALAIVTRTSTDNGVTWSRARIIVPDHTDENMPVESLFRANDGAIVLPCDKNPGSHVFLSYDDGQTWADSGGRIYGIHAGVTQLSDNRLMAFGRGDNINDKMPKSLSSDMGANWAYSASEFPPISGGQRVILHRLQEGPLLFISFTGSAGMLIDGQQVYGMFAALSYDEGLTWPVKKLITVGGPPTQYDGGGNTGWFTMDDTHAEPKGYLAMTQTPDSVIQLISSALHYRFNLAWLEHKDYVLVDDFESYTDQTGDNPIDDTWQDSGSDPDNGTLVGLETSIVRGYKSMQVYYDTAWPYCRALRRYSVGQDWTANQTKAMSLWFYGSAGNDPCGQVYVLAADTAGNAATSVYAGDANDIAEESWHEWQLDLEDFNSSGVDLTDVNTVAVGISGAGYGDIWFDDIRLKPARCISEYGPAGDLNADCVVDFKDLDVLSGDWLETEKMVTGVPPDADRLLLWYKFDETSGDIVSDYSGRSMDGYVDGPESGWEPGGGYNGGCRVFDDDTDVELPTETLTPTGDEITFAVWLNGVYRADYHNWVFDTGSGDFFLQAAVVTSPDRQAKWRAGYESDDVLLWDLDGRDPQDLTGEWHHWAFVKDAGEGVMQIYYDCLLEAEKSGAFGSPAGAAGAPFEIGAILSHHNDFIGKMDDFKVYSYALSQAEIAGAATGGGQLFVPAPASDLLHEDGKVDFADFAVLADSWLVEKLWPYQ